MEPGGGFSVTEYVMRIVLRGPRSMPAKEVRFPDFSLSRREMVLAVGAAFIAPATTARASESPDDLILYRGWVLRRSDLAGGRLA